jgi:hypothetical protein
MVPGQELPIRETTPLVEAYLRLKPNRRRGVFRLIQSMIESPTQRQRALSQEYRSSKSTNLRAP